MAGIATKLIEPQLRSVDAQPCRPPRDAPAGQKEIVRRRFVPRNIEADADQPREIEHQHHVVQRGKARLDVMRTPGPDLRRAVAGAIFTARHDDVAPKDDRRGGHLTERGVAQVGPGVGDRVISPGRTRKAGMLVPERFIAKEV
ncbi:MAG: hypothetical protein R2724_02060 [Bryobacterales bacterium]